MQSEQWAEVLSRPSIVDLPMQDRAFIGLARALTVVEDKVIIAVPNDFTKDVIETRLRPAVETAVQEVLGTEMAMHVIEIGRAHV